jgi:hypothetical protein
MVQRDLASVEAVERAEADALLKWCEKPALPVPTSVWHPEDDVLLVAGVGTFPTGVAHRWRSIAAMVPGKTAAQCQSRTRNDDFIKAHIFSGEKKGKPDSKLPPDPMTRDGDTDARLTELIIACTILDGDCDCDDDFTLEPSAADAPLMPSHCPLTLNPADSCADEQWLKVPTPRSPPDCDGTTRITYLFERMPSYLPASGLASFVIILVLTFFVASLPASNDYLHRFWDIEYDKFLLHKPGVTHCVYDTRVFKWRNSDDDDEFLFAHINVDDNNLTSTSTQVHKVLVDS